MFLNFLKDERGSTAIEYGLIAALIAVGVIAGMTATGTSLNELYDTNNGEIGAALDG
ncbi:Flp family type IVb pilin [Oceaniradius stylonematis]|jgi:pilus assembly protein Flp/PilA|nr:MAG: Flp family type IVb pilin [Oricola sp.]